MTPEYRKCPTGAAGLCRDRCFIETGRGAFQKTIGKDVGCPRNEQELSVS